MLFFAALFSLSISRRRQQTLACSLALPYFLARRAALPMLHLSKTRGCRAKERETGRAVIRRVGRTVTRRTLWRIRVALDPEAVLVGLFGDSPAPVAFGGLCQGPGLLRCCPKFMGRDPRAKNDVLFRPQVIAQSQVKALSRLARLSSDSLNAISSGRMGVNLHGWPSFSIALAYGLT